MNENNYSNLSKDELYLISRAEYERQKLITSEFANRLFTSPKRTAEVLDTLTRKGRLLQLQRGKYLPVPIKAPNQQWSPNEFMVAALWMGEIPYYIGYFTMYNYWGLTEQIPQTVFILNLKKNAKKTIGDVRYEALKIDEKKYFGIQKVKIEGVDICISDKERTLVDFIYNPIGSFDNVVNVIKECLPEIDLNKFINYLNRFPVISVRRRAGFYLTEVGCKDNILKKLQKNIGGKETYVALDPMKRSRKGKINQEWKIIVNR
jgi:predicted transcriptional regulator of viral defense system